MKKQAFLKLSTLLLLVLCISSVLSLALFRTDGYASDVAQTNTTLIDKNTTWRYLDNNTDPAAGLGSLTAWTEKDFDDSSWKSAAGTFGAKSGALGKINSTVTPNVLLTQYIEGTSTNIPAFFFRTTVTIDSLDGVDGVYIDAYGDDGYAFYINGHLISDRRSKQPEGNTNLYYTAPKSNSYRELKETLSVEKSYLVEGENVIAAIVHNESASSSDIYFGCNELSLLRTDYTTLYVDVPVLTVGTDVTERNLAWFSGNSDAGEVRLAKASEIVNGAFPSTYRTFTVTSKAAVNASQRYAKSTTLTGLEPDTDYAYVIVTAGNVSDIYYFETVPLGAYEFVYVGDPQISTQSHADSWADTLQKIQDNFGVDLLVSGGDQVNTANDEILYSYVIQDELLNFTFAPTVGPGHDSSCATFSDHFALPNKSTQYGVGTTSANYWYVYNNTLFMHLNMEDNDALFNGEHEAFITETLALNPNVKWTILVAHRAPYSTGLHGNPDYKNYSSEIAKIRPALSALATKMDIDIVLSAHDHVYVRTYIMNGTEVSADSVVGGKVINPEGVLYITANSSTGSKFYGQQVENAYFVAKENYEKRKSAIHFSVTDTSITLSTYFMDDMSVMDTFTIEKKEVSYTPDNALSTPYGMIDSAYADATAYPVVAFDRGGTFLGAYEDMSGAFNAFFNTKQDLIVFLRADAKFGYRYHNIGQGAGNKVIDLNGHTLTNDSSYLFYAQAKSSGYHKITVKNGTIDTAGNLLWTLGAKDSSSAANKKMDCVFEGVTFKNISKSLVTDNSISSSVAVISTVTFNDCTFENPTAPLFTLGNSALATQNVIVCGGKVVTNDKALPTIIQLGKYSENTTLTFQTGEDGRCMKIYTAKNDSAEAIATMQPNVFFAKSEAESSSAESVYILSEKTPYGFIDEEHLDATKYPMVLYLGDKVLYPDTYGEETGNTVVKQYFMDNPTKDAILYIRTSCSLGGKNYWTGNIASTFTIDLGGNTVAVGCLFYLQSRKANNATIIVKDGTLTLAGAIATFGTNNANGKHTDLTFENVTFNNVKKTMYSIGHNNKNDTYKTYTMSANVTFNNCTFHVISSMEGAFLNLPADERCTITTEMNGCTINLENGTYAIFESNGDAGDTVTFNAYKGKETTIQLASTVDVKTVTEQSATGAILGLRKTGTSGDNAIYTLTPFDITSAYVNLTNDINIVYRVFLPSGYENPVATFIVTGTAYEVSEYTIDENGLALFKLSALGPHKMGDTISVCVRATYLGVEETVTKEGLTVKTYIDTVRAQNSENTELCSLLDALLVYGASAQVYRNYNTDSLVADIGTLASIPAGTILRDGEANADYQIASASLRLNGAFDLSVKIKAKDIDGLKVRITKGESTVEVSVSEDMRVGDTYAITYNALTASELDEELTFTLVKDGAAIGTAIALSANTYLSKLETSENTALSNLVKALYAYGVCANAYAD